MDCYHQHLTCLPHLERRQTIFHPQTRLLSSCHCYYSNSVVFEISLWTPGSLNAVLIPKADTTVCSFSSGARGPLPHTITRSSTSHHKAVEMVSVKHHNFSNSLQNQLCCCVSQAKGPEDWDQCRHPSERGNCHRSTQSCFLSWLRSQTPLAEHNHKWLSKLVALKNW